MSLPFDLGPWQPLWLAIAIFGAAFVRSYSGFGFAAQIVSAAGLVTDLLHLVPVVLPADIILTAQQARSIRAHVDWRRVGWLLAGCGVPLRVSAIAEVGADTARVAISVYVLVMCGVLLAGWRLIRPPGAAEHIGTGMVRRMTQRSAACRSRPFFAAQTRSAATFRATLIAHFTTARPLDPARHGVVGDDHPRHADRHGLGVCR